MRACFSAVRGRHRAALALAMPLALSALLLAQSQQPIRVGTNFVRVDVYPTRDGRIVDGLQSADFEVLEDGVPQKDVTVARRAVVSPVPSETAILVKAAIDRLGSLRPSARLRINAVVGPGPLRSVWVTGEVQSTGARPDEFMQGARAAIEAIAGGTSVTASVTLKSGELSFLTRLDVPGPPAGAVDVRVRLASDEGTREPLSEGVRVDPATGAPAPLMFRRSVTTGNRWQPAADPRFSRTERMRLEFPVGPGPRDGKAAGGRVIDRGGVATQVPVSVSERYEEGTGQRWITADLSLAALSPGDYAIEVVIVRESKEERLLTPIRVVM